MVPNIYVQVTQKYRIRLKLSKVGSFTHYKFIHIDFEWKCVIVVALSLVKASLISCSLSLITYLYVMLSSLDHTK